MGTAEAEILRKKFYSLKKSKVTETKNAFDTLISGLGMIEKRSLSLRICQQKNSKHESKKPAIIK
jgi:hypothetical protein